MATQSCATIRTPRSPNAIWIFYFRRESAKGAVTLRFVMPVNFDPDAPDGDDGSGSATGKTGNDDDDDSATWTFQFKATAVHV